MGISAINLLSSVFQSVTGSSNKTANTTSSSGTSTQLDNGQLSPFAQMLSELQQLEQSNPTKYDQVTGQIATNLKSAAQTASAAGDTTAANNLNTLATDFQTASQTGQLPNIQDLAQAIQGGGHHHHHGHHAAPSSGTGSSSSSSSNTTDSLLAMFQSPTSTNNSLDPMSIIMNTLSSASTSTT